jgi:Acyclic terpene utilisation family protein AtuA
MSRRSIRIGAGSAHEGDDLDAARLVAEQGNLDYIAFDCTSEKAISQALIRRSNGLPAFDAQL